MVSFVATIKRFATQGEKTGWTYIEIPEPVIDQIKKGYKKSFRVKGKLDAHTISAVALLPMGGGQFIMPLNADIRKSIKKRLGESLSVKLEEDKEELKPPADLMACLENEPKALQFFSGLTKGHQNYFGKWIDSAKTEKTRAKRIAQTVEAMLAKQDYGTMIRSHKKIREEWR